jgi:hypothetical protein
MEAIGGKAVRKWSELIDHSTSLYYETTAINLGPQLPSTPQRTCRYFEASKKIFPQLEVGTLNTMHKGKDAKHHLVCACPRTWCFWILELRKTKTPPNNYFQFQYEEMEDNELQIITKCYGQKTNYSPVRG